VLGEVLRQYTSVPSSELRHLSHVLIELLCISDPVQEDRLALAVYGEEQGLLQLVRAEQKSDTSRAYQAIKCLVNASTKNQVVKDHLFLQPTRWQWAVNWLKNKMDGGNYWSHSSGSNEDSNNRTFHRTTSAQVTLEEANAMLAEFDTDVVMEDQPEKETEMSVDGVSVNYA